MPTIGQMRNVKDLLNDDHASVIVGVHNALGAWMAQEAGADGVWVSSFEVHASARLPDADILSTEDYVYAVAQMSDRIQIPVLVDGNAGGGNAINTIRLVREFQKAGAMGMCIEDNPFPKRCSFYDGMQEEMEPTETFCGKIQAAIEKRTDPDFAIIARTEAVIKGYGIDVALERCKAYVGAGAEAILIHHKGSDPETVLEFADRWYADETAPLVCVPTTYNTVTYQQLDSAGFRLIIFANYGIRAIVKALRTTFGAIMENKRLADGNDHVVSMDTIFDLIFLGELKDNEARYLR